MYDKKYVQITIDNMSICKANWIKWKRDGKSSDLVKYIEYSIVLSLPFSFMLLSIS